MSKIFKYIDHRLHYSDTDENKTEIIDGIEYVYESWYPTENKSLKELFYDQWEKENPVSSENKH